jgi:hypothetical protein
MKVLPYIELLIKSQEMIQKAPVNAIPDLPVGILISTSSKKFILRFTLRSDLMFTTYTQAAEEFERYLTDYKQNVLNCTVRNSPSARPPIY